MLMVVVLIAAITGLTIGLLGVGRSSRQLKDAVHTVATELRYTPHPRADDRAVPQRFAIDLDKRTWTAADHRGVLPRRRCQIGFDAVRVEQTLAREAAIKFFPDGSATGGRINLRTARRGLAAWTCAG